MQSKFREFSEYLECGLSPIPLMEGKKRPLELSWQEYCSKQPEKEKIQKWEAEVDLNHIGLCLGTEVVTGQYLAAIDVDDDDLVEPVWKAIGKYDAPAKIGSKGITIFVLADSDVINQKIKRKGADGKPMRLPSVEILCHGSQTVVPPSIHPTTQKPYTWTTQSITNGFPNNLPVINQYTIDEIIAACQGKGNIIENLNTMIWLGLDKGGNTHDTCVEAVAWMVSRGWPDAYIHNRIERAKAEACERNGDEYNWSGSSKAIQGWIDSAREKGMTNSSSKRKRPKERVMADWLIDELGGIENVVTSNGGTLRYYKDGHWAEADLSQIKRSMYLADETLKKADVENALQVAHMLVYRDHFGYTEGIEPKFDAKRRRICLLNGTLNTMTMELEKHDKDHELTNQIDIVWDEDADCPRYKQFMWDSLGDQKLIDLMNEYAGLTLVPDMSFQKILFLLGPGGNGKGTWTKLLASCHDVNALSSVSITDLNDERKRYSLRNSYLNISGEQTSYNMISDVFLKKITGQDPIDMRPLYCETINNVFVNTRFIESLNEMPRTTDTTDALRRRMIIIPWENKPKQPNNNLLNELKQERAGILKLWVESLNKLYDRGYFDEPEQSKAQVEEYLMTQNPIAMWVKERCEPSKEGDMGTPSNDLYGDFREWAIANGYNKPFTNVYWGQKVTYMGYPSEVRRVGGTSTRVRGLNLKAGAFGSF